MKINAFYAGAPQLESIFLPKPLFIRLRILKAQVAHIDIHQGRAAEKIVRFIGDNRNGVFAVLANVPGGGDAANTVAEDDDVHEVSEAWTGLQMPKRNFGGH